MYNQALITLRKARSLTQEQLATLAQVNRSTLAQYESGKLRVMPAEKVYRLARALQMPMELLYVSLYPEAGPGPRSGAGPVGAGGVGQEETHRDASEP